NGVTALFIDSAKRFWVGTWGGGLNRFDPVTGQFTRLHDAQPNRAETGSAYIADIKEGPNGNIWIATDAGVLQLDPETGAFQLIHHAADDSASLVNDSVKTL